MACAPRCCSWPSWRCCGSARRSSCRGSRRGDSACCSDSIGRRRQKPFGVNQCDAQPLFVVTAPANDGLIARLRQQILPEVRRLVGDRRVTLVFDREGWSPKFFREIHAQGFDVLTARKGAYATWPVKAFQTVTGTVDGRRVRYELAERAGGGRHGVRG